MKRVIAIAVVAVLLLAAASTLLPAQASLPAAQPTTIPTTIPYDIQAPGANAVDINNGGVFKSGIAIEGDANENQLVIEAYATQTADLVFVETADGTELFGIEDDGAIDSVVDVEHFGLPSVISVPITYTASTGGTGTVATIGAGEKWIIWDIYVETTTNFDVTGDDATMIIGDGNDTDGFCVLADAAMQTTYAAFTGASAGWSCMIEGDVGVYMDPDGTDGFRGGYVYDESTAETIDWTVSEASGDTLSAGAATIYVIYTRIL